jgi:hypothetical protein
MTFSFTMKKPVGGMEDIRALLHAVELPLALLSSCIQIFHPIQACFSLAAY